MVISLRFVCMYSTPRSLLSSESGPSRVLSLVQAGIAYGRCDHRVFKLPFCLRGTAASEEGCHDVTHRVGIFGFKSWETEIEVGDLGEGFAVFWACEDAAAGLVGAAETDPGFAGGFSRGGGCC